MTVFCEIVCPAGDMLVRRMASSEPQITFTLVNGETFSFFLPDEETLKAHLCPNTQATLFDTPHLLFGNGISLFGVRTDAIAWLRIHPSIELPWTFFPL